ncbi:MAG: response regulator [Candidatus Sericytochromatia bacterium]
MPAPSPVKELNDGPYQILLVDDHPIVTLGITQLLESDKRFQVCATASSAEKALEKAEACKPDLAILDISLSGEVNGLELTRQLRQCYPQLGLLLLSIHPEQQYALHALRMGANGYIMKEEATARLIESVEAVLLGKLCFSPQVTQEMLVQLAQEPQSRVYPAPQTFPGLDLLSDREREVFSLMGHGFQVREIAKLLSLAPKTVHTHRLNIMHKLKLTSTARLNHLAFEWTQLTMNQ